VIEQGEEPGAAALKEIQRGTAVFKPQGVET
jgi:hypothetical protein